eukprot:TRINITY_DN8377_c0_g1_i1.p1 TRINITY_DN8377_c0_g1~~TRINITY_DN8377_c0_g1_i1.p1  ORF type:complete len:560 (+),score=92.06 TRINITY_DN8377_c0_g1_i1:215-1894(+)
MENLPDEIVGHVLFYLPPVRIWLCKRVCKTWRRIIEQNEPWIPVCRRYGLLPMYAVSEQVALQNLLLWESAIATMEMFAEGSKKHAVRLLASCTRSISLLWVWHTEAVGHPLDYSSEPSRTVAKAQQWCDVVRGVVSPVRQELVVYRDPLSGAELITTDNLSTLRLRQKDGTTHATRLQGEIRLLSCHDATFVSCSRPGSTEVYSVEALLQNRNSGSLWSSGECSICLSKDVLALYGRYSVKVYALGKRKQRLLHTMATNNAGCACYKQRVYVATLWQDALTLVCLDTKHRIAEGAQKTETMLFCQPTSGASDIVVTVCQAYVLVAVETRLFVFLRKGLQYLCSVILPGVVEQIWTDGITVNIFATGLDRTMFLSTQLRAPVETDVLCIYPSGDVQTEVLALAQLPRRLARLSYSYHSVTVVQNAQYRIVAGFGCTAVAAEVNKPALHLFQQALTVNSLEQREVLHVPHHAEARFAVDPMQSHEAIDLPTVGRSWQDIRTIARFGRRMKQMSGVVIFVQQQWVKEHWVQVPLTFAELAVRLGTPLSTHSASLLERCSVC